MQTSVGIDFQGMPGTPEIRDDIAKRVAELEERYGRVTSCRVVLKGPGGHHRTGGLYEVNIRLALPNGREVNVARTAPADERQPQFCPQRCLQASAPALAGPRAQNARAGEAA